MKEFIDPKLFQTGACSREKEFEKRAFSKFQ
jgi:hypothetical protein